MSTSLFGWLGCALALGACGCSQTEPLARADAAIFGGSEAPDDQNVVAVVNFAGGQCSGSLIAPQLVLTARHCVAKTAERDRAVVCGQTTFEPPNSPGAIFVVPLPSVTEDPEDYAPVSAIRMPDGVADDLCGSDVVLLVLDAPLTAIAPLTPRLEPTVMPGEAYSAVGFGVDEALADTPSGVRKRLDGLEVTCAAEACADADVRGNEWVGSGGPCSGDSGGPALDQDGQVIGVVSRGKEGCGEPVFGDVASRAAWLKSEAIAVANAAGRVPPAWAPCDEANPCRRPSDDEAESSCALSGATLPLSHAWPFVLAGLALGLRLSAKRKSRASEKS